MLTVLAFYAKKPKYQMGKVDVKGASIQTPIKGEPVYMRVNKKVSKYVLELYPMYVEVLQNDGGIIVKLLKAMYGCIQTSRLWFNLLTKVLRSVGYVTSETDPCVIR
jgi:hypothetical protein